MASLRYNIGDTVLNNWRLVKKLGQGSFGTVYEAHRDEFGITYKAAIKIIRIPYDESEIFSAKAEGMSDESIADYYRGLASEIVQEFVLMSKLKGTTNIVSYEDHAVIEHNEEIGFDILIRMELLRPMLVHMNSSQMTQADIVRMGIDICKALEVCQKHNIIHRDIKPENMFVSEHGDFVLGDFGIARTVEKTLGNMSKKGTYTYMAPEVYREDMYGPNVDIYSLGIVMYRLLNFNRTPFLPMPPINITHNDRELALIRRFSGEEIPQLANAEKRVSQIVLKACAYDPRERYSNPREMRLALERVFSELETEKETDAYKEDDPGEHTITNSNRHDSESEATQRTKADRTISSGTSRTGKFANTSKSSSFQKPQYKEKSPKRKSRLSAILIAVCTVIVLGILVISFTGENEDESLKHDERVPTTTAEETESSSVSIGEETYPLNTTQLRLGHFEDEDLGAVKRLSQLETIIVFNDGNGSDFSLLKSYCDSYNIDFQVEIAGKTVIGDVKSIELDDVTEEDTALFHLLADKEQILIRNPRCSAKTLFELDELLVSTEFSWECYIADTTYNSNTISEKLNLSGKQIESLQTLEEQLSYFLSVNEVYLGVPSFKNEEVAAFRERVVDSYKVVWEVACGENLSIRTDAETLIPAKTGLGRFTDSDAYNLRYCNEMKAIDLGHMTITNIDFVAFMPELKYLCIPWTDIKDISPLAYCGELIFLELDNSCVYDLTPLKSCTKLEDLNVGNTDADFTALYDMPWLKNLYMINCRETEAWQIANRCPDINIVTWGSATVSSGWRELQNYYDMRDLFGMPYMSSGSTKTSEAEPVQQTIGLGIIINTESGVNVRSGAGTSYPSVGKYLPNTTVEILETTTVDGTQWGRTENGWVSMVYVELVHNDSVWLETTGNTQYKGKIINSPYLNVRENPSTQATLVGSAAEGTEVTIYETLIAENMAWGRCDMGWVYLYYVDLTPVDKTYVDARVVYNDNTVIYSDVECSDVVGTYDKMTVVNIFEYNGRLAKTDLGWVLTDNLL